jgi:hypothetical protein
MKHLSTILASYTALALSCAAAPGTKPHDASAAQHEAMADQEMRAAEGHTEQHDPSATESSTKCSAKRGCWTSVSNPTAEHAAAAARHRELAEKHRAASQALKDAEGKACVGLSEEDRDMSPFHHREDIESVSPLVEEQKAGKGTIKKEVGITVVFRAVPGLTAEWLQRVVDCHLARAAAVGHDMPEMAYCPLMPKGAKAKVTSAGTGFAVNVSADDAATIAEIQKRGQALSAK